MTTARKRSTAAAVVALLLITAAPALARGPSRLPRNAASPAQALAVAAPTFDYTEVEGLSQPTYGEIETTAMKLPMADGTQIYLEITKPKTTEPTRFPVIFEASPYHGTIATRIGDRIFPDPKNADGTNAGLTGYFAPRGYAVVMMDLRGTGRSTGCLDHLGPNDASDMKQTIEWLAGQEWSNGRIGMTGHSYVGSTPVAAAAKRPEGLVTIAPSAGLASMYDHQFQRGVPYNLQYIGPMVAYESLALWRDAPPQTPSGGLPAVGAPSGDNWTGTPNPETGCGMKNTAALAGTGEVTGQYELWHAQRDWREEAADVDIPVFMIHGVNDNAARIPAAEWFFANRFNRPGDKVWIGQWDHGSTNGRCGNEENQRVSHPNCRFDQWVYALHAWFDKHLAQRDVDTGPAVEAFLNGVDAVDVTQVMDPEQVGGKVYSADGWKRPEERIALYPASAGKTLSTEAGTDGTVTLNPTANALLASNEAESVFARFVSEPLQEDTLFLGLPRFDLHASVANSQIVHFVATLARVDEGGVKESMNTCAGAPLLRDSIHTLSPVVPRQEMSIPLQCFTMAHWVPAGNRLELTIGTNDAPEGSPHHATYGADGQITLFTGSGNTEYLLPVVPGFTLTDDVDLR